MTSLYVTLYNSMGTAKKIAPLDTAGTCASYITSARGQGIGSVRFERGLEIKIPLIRAKKGSPSQIQIQKMASILVRPNLYREPSRPCRLRTLWLTKSSSSAILPSRIFSTSTVSSFLRKSGSLSSTWHKLPNSGQNGSTICYLINASKLIMILSFDCFSTRTSLRQRSQ